MSHRVANEIRTGSLTPLSQEFNRFLSEHSPAVPYIEGTTLAFLLLKGLKEPRKATYRGNLCLKVGHKHYLYVAVSPTMTQPWDKEEASRPISTCTALQAQAADSL